MNIIEKIESQIDWNKEVDDQLEKLAQFDNLTDEEIKFISEKGHKSSEVGILLKYLGPRKLNKFLPDFLIFLQDMNWPAGYGAAYMLLKSREAILPEIQRVFKEEDDDIWKHGILLNLIQHWTKELIEKIKSELIFITVNESKHEKEGIAIKALLILRKHDLISKEEYLRHYNNIELEYLADEWNDWKEDLLELKSASS